MFLGLEEEASLRGTQERFSQVTKDKTLKATYYSESH